MEIGQLRFLVIWWCSTVQGGSVFVGRCYKGPNGLLGWIEWRSWWLGHLQGVFVPYLGFGLRWFCTDSIPWDSSPWISTHQFGRKIYSANLSYVFGGSFFWRHHLLQERQLLFDRLGMRCVSIRPSHRCFCGSHEGLLRDSWSPKNVMRGLDLRYRWFCIKQHEYQRYIPHLKKNIIPK